MAPFALPGYVYSNVVICTQQNHIFQFCVVGRVLEARVEKYFLPQRQV